ncbi:MAG TPA: NAD(P)/FAD-dependent oxidoreductase [Propionibacterium sp.]|nr:NAD(P)/FAD-dependent oxidoreductase [Propionibacterium sp.]
MKQPHVVIAGGGFGGLTAAGLLAKQGCRVTLIDRHAYTTFQPLLYQVATGGLNPGDITYSLRAFAARYRRRVRFRRAYVTGIDTERRTVSTDVGDPIDYDYLVLALGVGANFFGIPGAKEHAKSIYTRAEALDVRDVVFGQIEALSMTETDETLTIMVVGGGATGVEMAGALAEMRTQGLPIAYPEIHPDRVRIMLVEMGPALLAPFDEKLQRYTLEELRKREVDVRLNAALQEVRPHSVIIKEGDDEREEQADLVIWGGGIGAHEIVNEWGLEQGKGGRIVVGDDLRVKGQDRVFAVGDCAVNPDNPLPQVAQPALQMGRHVAATIAATIKGVRTQPFRYRDKGSMATIGRSAAVVEVKGGPKLTGLPAWLSWVVLHLSFLLSNRNRLAAMINLGVRYLMYPRNANTIIGDIAKAEQAELADR